MSGGSEDRVLGVLRGGGIWCSGEGVSGALRTVSPALTAPFRQAPHAALNLRLMLKMLAHYRISMADYVSGELEHVTRRTLSIDKGF